MAYSKFTPRDLINNFGVNFNAKNLFAPNLMIEPSDWLKTTLERGLKVGFSSEKSRAERLVSPILMELSERNNYDFTIYSGEMLNVDEQSGLSGECDFMFSFSKIVEFVTAPVFCITEAKKQDLESGIIQCAAQLIGAKKFNEEIEGKPIETIYGCSTTGIEWNFLKLENQIITIDRTRYYTTDLSKLLGALQEIINIQTKIN